MASAKPFRKSTFGSGSKAKLKELEKSDENSWQKFQAELDKLVADVNDDIRGALAYFG